MIPTNRQPPGLLSFFGVKNGGRMPEYPEGASYAPYLCMNDWLFADPLASEVLGANQNVPAVNAINIGTGAVPAGQVWLVLNAGAQASAVLGAGVTWQGCLVHNQAGAPAMFEPIGPPSVLTTVGQVPNLGTYRTNPFFLRQGDSIAVYTMQLTGAAFAISTSIRFIRLGL